jgi:hypothetical protein
MNPPIGPAAFASPVTSGVTAPRAKAMVARVFGSERVARVTDRINPHLIPPPGKLERASAEARQRTKRASARMRLPRSKALRQSAPTTCRKALTPYQGLWTAARARC